MIVGSLIKNPGGGLAPIGGYNCGQEILCGAGLLPVKRRRDSEKRWVQAWD